MSSCKIYLNKSESIYTVGDEITGRVECNFTKSTTIRSIKIGFKCKEHIGWAKRGSSSTGTIYSKDNYVLQMEQILLSPNHDETLEIECGQYVYPFSFSLPSEMPVSFRGQHGYVEYKIKAVVDIPLWRDDEDKMLITVLSPIDFNKMDRELQNPVRYSEDQTICCFCIGSTNDIAVDVELPKTAFVLGETINFDAHVCNHSSTNIDSLEVELSKKILYSGDQYHNREEKDVIVAFKEHGVGAHGEHTFNLNVAVPKDYNLLNFVSCQFIKVQYVLEISCQMLCKKLQIPINIHIGHVPYNYKNTVIPLYPSVPPPSYSA